MRDDLPKDGPRKHESGIVNLDSKHGCGTHWVAYKKSNNIIRYFDSFGNLKPCSELVSYLNNCRILYNQDKYQNLGYNCGHLCLQFLIQ